MKIIHQRKKIGYGVSEERPVEETMDGFSENLAPEEPVQEQIMAFRPLKRSFSTFRKRRKIGGEFLEEEYEKQKAKLREQINELPKDLRRAFLEELLENIK